MNHDCPVNRRVVSESMYLRWSAIPNAYTYQVEIYKKGALFKKSPLLDVISGKVSDRFQISFDGTWAEWYSRGKLPAGTYAFRVRALNKGNPAGQQESLWSDMSREFSVQ